MICIRTQYFIFYRLYRDLKLKTEENTKLVKLVLYRNKKIETLFKKDKHNKIVYITKVIGKYFYKLIINTFMILLKY